MLLEEAKQILVDNGYTLALNESINKRYLDYAIQDVADQLYEEELSDEQPEVDEYGNVNLEYFKRFEYREYL